MMVHTVNRSYSIA